MASALMPFRLYRLSKDGRFDKQTSAKRFLTYPEKPLRELLERLGAEINFLDGQLSNEAETDIAHLKAFSQIDVVNGITV